MKYFLSTTLHSGEVKEQKGFTLIETIVVISIFSILMYGATVVFKQVFTDSGQQNAAIDVIEQARGAEYTFVNELRNATTGIDGSYPITQADPRELTLYTRYDGRQSATVNKVHYYIASSTLYKGTIIPSGSPLTYNKTSEKIKIVQASIASTTAPIFYYYDSNYSGVESPLTQPVNLNSIKFVQLSADVLTKAVKNGTATFKVTAGATIRNLKTNLGN